MQSARISCFHIPHRPRTVTREQHVREKERIQESLMMSLEVADCTPSMRPFSKKKTATASAVLFGKRKSNGHLYARPVDRWGLEVGVEIVD